MVNTKSLARIQLSKFNKFLTKLLLPSFCIACQRETPEEPASLRWLCLDCHKLLASRWAKTSYLPEIAEAYYLFDYQKDKLAQKLIHAFKYGLVKEISAVFDVVLEKERLAIKKLNFEAIVPIPLHHRKLKERGFNQSLLVAQKISEMTGQPILENAIERKIYRRPQMAVKNRETRLKNIQNIFECVDAEKIKGQTILLVDDVATTGATLKECARVLKTAGAGKILSFTLAQD